MGCGSTDKERYRIARVEHVRRNSTGFPTWYDLGNMGYLIFIKKPGSDITVFVQATLTFQPREAQKAFRIWLEETGR